MKNPILNIIAFLGIVLLMVSCSEDNLIPNNELIENSALQSSSFDDDSDLVYYDESGKSEIKFKMQTVKVEDDTGASYQVHAYGRFVDKYGTLVLIHVGFLLDDNGEIIGSKAQVTDGEEVSEYLLQDSGKSIPSLFNQFVFIQTGGNSFSTSPGELSIELDMEGKPASFFAFEEAGIQIYRGLVKKI